MIQKILEWLVRKMHWQAGTFLAFLYVVYKAAAGVY